MPTSPAPGLTNDPSNKPTQAGRFSLPRDITPAERSTLIAGSLGWLLDAMDVMLFSLVLAYLVREFSMDTRTAGFLNSLTLIASAIGGFFFGFLADRIGRTRALMASILVYSIASAACAFTHTIPQLGFCRFVLGLGMGGEWTTAAALIAETWRAEHRGKALGLMQSAYAIGEAVAALVVAVVFPHFGWRAVFLVGFLPALMVLWIRSRVPESELWQRRAAQPNSRHSHELLRDVRLLGIVRLDSRLPFYSNRARRPRPQPCKDYFVFPDPLRWQMAGLCALRFFCGCIWPKAPVFRISSQRGSARSGVWTCPYAALAADPGPAVRLFWYWIFFGIRGHRQRDFPR